MTTQQAVEQLVKALKEDSEYYESWKANIAMAFKDQYHRTDPNFIDTGGGAELVHDVANKAADNFLQTLMR